MKRSHIHIITTCLALFCATFLTGCSDLFTTKNSEPYSATEAMRMFSKSYGIDVELRSQEVVKGPPYAVMRYVLKPKKENFTFTLNATVHSDRSFGWTSKVYSDNYSSALMYYCRTSAQAFAADYSLLYVPIASPNDRAEDRVFLNSPAQIPDAVSLYFDLLGRYNFPPKLDRYATGTYSVYYLPASETDLTKAVPIKDYHYGSDSIDTPEKFRIDLSGWWNDKWRSKQIPEATYADPNRANTATRTRERLHAD